MFTKRSIESLPVTGKMYTEKDTKVPGLVVLVSPKGAKTFYVYRWLNGRPERIKLGRFPQMTVEQARTQAQAINGEIAIGKDPASARRALRATPTFGETFQDFLDKKRTNAGKPLAPLTKYNYRVVSDLYLAPLMKLKLSQITPEVVRRIKIKSDSQNNQAKRILGSVFVWARNEGLTDVPNPASVIKSRHVPSRERFLQPAEVPAFLAAVDESPMRDLFLLLLLTGARRGNVCAMRWQDIDIGQAVWRIPHTKNGEAQNVPLVPEAMQILQARKSQKVIHSTWVFPSIGKTGHIIDPTKAWNAVLQKAGISNMRVHDLRRTLGSWQARQGASLTVIGKSLGHKSTSATQIYSRLDLDPVRHSVESATTALLDHKNK